MKRRNLHARQWSLLEERIDWSDLPRDVRQLVSDHLAQLLMQKLKSSNKKQEPSHDAIR